MGRHGLGVWGRGGGQVGLFPRSLLVGVFHPCCGKRRSGLVLLSSSPSPRLSSCYPLWGGHSQLRLLPIPGGLQCPLPHLGFLIMAVYCSITFCTTFWISSVLILSGRMKAAGFKQGGTQLGQRLLGVGLTLILQRIHIGAGEGAWPHAAHSTAWHPWGGVVGAHLQRGERCTSLLLPLALACGVGSALSTAGTNRAWGQGWHRDRGGTAWSVHPVC